MHICTFIMKGSGASGLMAVEVANTFFGFSGQITVADICYMGGDIIHDRFEPTVQIIIVCFDDQNMLAVCSIAGLSHAAAIQNNWGLWGVGNIGTKF